MLCDFLLKKFPLNSIFCFRKEACMACLYSMSVFHFIKCVKTKPENNNKYPLGVQYLSRVNV